MVSKFLIFCTGRRVSLNINKFILHFKLSSGTLAKKSNDINISILDYSFIKFQIKLYIVTERFLLNSNISIWLCNHERNFGQINLLQKFLRILIIVKNNAKILELKQWKYDHNQRYDHHNTGHIVDMFDLHLKFLGWPYIKIGKLPACSQNVFSGDDFDAVLAFSVLMAMLGT